jgi:hypothetical protein
MESVCRPNFPQVPRGWYYLCHGSALRPGPVGLELGGRKYVAWNSSALPREWIAGVNRLRADYPNGPYYWLLITSGFRTYRLLSTFWQRFSPRFDEHASPANKGLLDQLASERFGALYDPSRGVITFERPQILKPHLCGVPDTRAAVDPHVAFFARRNPGHVRGEELACLCELSEDNLTRAGRRMVFGTARNA